MAAMEGTVNFILACRPWEATELPVDGSTTLYTREAPSELSEFEKEHVKLQKESGGRTEKNIEVDLI